MLNDALYYLSKHLMAFKADFYYGCKTKPRTIVTKKNIPETDYTFATLKADQWNASDAKCRKAQLLITKEWVDKYYFETVPMAIVSQEQSEISEDECVTENNKNKVEYKVAPDIIHLTDDEKFTDENGDMIEIETRGEKTETGIYFKVSDVAKGFNMERLNDTMYQPHSGYVRGIDYATFIQGNNGTAVVTSFKKCLYVTYTGLCRVLFVSRNKHTKRFQSWATNKLFTIQMGQEPERKKLGAALCGLSVRQVADVFGADCAECFPSIYLLSLGLVKDVRATFCIDADIDDTLMVYKFGFTKDLPRRLKEHELTYGKMEGVVLNMIAFHYIDTKFMCKVEGEMREFCKTFELKLNLEGNTYIDLIVLNKKQLPQIKTQYKYIGKAHAGSTAELQKQIEDQAAEIKDNISKHTIELNAKVIESLQKDLIIQEEKSKFDYLKMQSDLTNQLLRRDVRDYFVKYGEL
jgi:hypothetical protein